MNTSAKMKSNGCPIVRYFTRLITNKLSPNRTIPASISLTNGVADIDSVAHNSRRMTVNMVESKNLIFPIVYWGIITLFNHFCDAIGCFRLFVLERLKNLIRKIR